MSFPGTAARTGRPAAAGLLAEQLRHTVVDLWRVRVVFVFTFLFPLTWLVVIGFLAGNATVDEDSGVRVMQFVTPTAVVMGVLYAAWPTVATALATAREQGGAEAGARNPPARLDLPRRPRRGAPWCSRCARC